MTLYIRIWISMVCIFIITCCKPSVPSLSLDKEGIPFDPSKDNPNFIICDETRIKQYFQFHEGIPFKGEKKAIQKYYLQNFNQQDSSTNGILRIRFIVNCHGETGRFRLMMADEKYNKQEMSKDVTSHLMYLTKNLNGWKVLSDYNGTIDYFQYLSFVLSKGKVKTILP